MWNLFKRGHLSAKKIYHQDIKALVVLDEQNIRSNQCNQTRAAMHGMMPVCSEYNDKWMPLAHESA
jgi:hypothetical protein